ncbi:hypothetical protein POM88_052684 [Heracleum sosnowskyi]|uniref:Uncharacterized protein n=1 Tax=Heracleum sosnowskyi TaxID=360622 RepID=A0AAD8LXL1_9APIA|nr:hypothetical protein POM88_052684 [Heracleum sosnowskyi]
MKRRRVENDLVVKRAGEGSVSKDGKKISICGISTRMYYDKSDPRYRISAVRMNQMLSFAELAIRFYNIKENTNFGKVKVRKVVRAMSGIVDNRITFKAFSPLGVATIFETEVWQYFGPDRQIEIRYVRIKPSHRDHNSNNSGQELPPDVPPLQTLTYHSLKELAPALSQYALVMYTIFTLCLKKVAAHDIPSLEVVRAEKLDAEEQARLIQGLAFKMCFVKEHEQN